MKICNVARKRKVLFLNDTTDWYHFGCTATCMAIKEEVIKLGFNVTSLPITETYKFNLIPTEFLDFESVKAFEIFKKHNQNVVKLLQEHDIILINGEGTLHGLRPAPMGLLYIAFIAKRFLYKHIEIINHSVYPQDNLSLDNKEITSFYKLVYNSIDFCAIREPISLNLMRQLSIEAVESFDCLPLYVKNHYNFHNKKEDKTLLIAGSATWLHLNILSDDKGTIEEYEKSLTGFINYLNKMVDKGYKIEFLYGAKDYPAKDDREFIAFIEPRLSCKWSVITAHSLDNWISHIEKASLLVSGRFHHTIAAQCVGTPFIVLESNTPKIKGLMRSLSSLEEVISWNDKDLTRKLLERSENVQQKAFSPNILEKLCEKAIQNFCGLQKLLYLDSNWKSFVQEKKDVTRLEK